MVNLKETYKFANIDWIILDKKDNQLLLLSKYVLEIREYNDKEQIVKWENCTLRKYLNDEFYNNFLDRDKKRIIEKRNINEENPEYKTKGGNDTIDHIFLLSIQEVRDYFFSNENRIAYSKQGEARWWWLRSPGLYSYFASYVFTDGIVSTGGINIEVSNGGVRPALWIKLY